MSAVNSASSSSSLNSIYNTNSRVTGMFSSLDTDALVKSMTSAQQAKIDNIRRQQTRQQWTNDALTSVKDDINDFLNTYASVTGSSSMLKAATYNTYKVVTSSTSNAVAITASSSVITGNISVQVNKLAQNASTSSSGKVSANGTEIAPNNTTTLGNLSLATPLQFDAAGKISFGINGKTFTFSKDDTLQNMINTINNDATANVTMTYSRLTDSFSITADSGGAKSSVSITNSTGNAFGPDGAFKIGTGTFTDGRSDAVAVINGTTVTRDSNNFTIDGLTYNLKKVTKDTSEEKVEFTVDRDYSTTVDAVSKLVDAYNTLYKKLTALYNETDNSKDYPPLTEDQKSAMSADQITAWETKAKSGLLRHNSDLGNMISALKNTFYSAIGGTGSNATNIGLTNAGYFESNAGQAVLDKDKLTNALQNDAETVIKMFTNGSTASSSTDQGLIYRFRSILTSYTSTVSDTIDSGTTKITDYGKEISTQEDKLSALADRYYAKFSKMETALSKLNTQASYISQMFTTGK